MHGGLRGGRVGSPILQFVGNTPCPGATGDLRSVAENGGRLVLSARGKSDPRVRNQGVQL